MMKRREFLRMMCAVTVAAVLVSCSKDNDTDNDGGNNWFASALDVDTGISLSTGGTLIVLDRNVGAEHIGDYGDYITWDAAKAACPEGYHLMTSAEATLLIAEFQTAAALRDGILKMPLAGYKEFGETSISGKDRFAYYWLYEEYGEMIAASLCIDEFSLNDELSLNGDEKAYRQSARCVKGEPYQPSII